MEQEQESDGQQVRMSFTMDAYTRRQVRIAAAYADMEIGEWATKVLREAAERATGADRGMKKKK